MENQNIQSNLRLNPEQILSVFSTTVTSLNLTDELLLSSPGAGNPAIRLSVALFRAYLTQGIVPIIGIDGYWKLGNEYLLDEQGNRISAGDEAAACALAVNQVHAAIVAANHAANTAVNAARIATDTARNIPESLQTELNKKIQVISLEDFNALEEYTEGVLYAVTDDD